MNNSELAEALSVDHGLTKADARKLVDALFGVIADAAAKGDEISLNGFGRHSKSSPLCFSAIRMRQAKGLKGRAASAPHNS